MHLVKMTMKWPSSMISRGPKMFRYKIHWKLTYKNHYKKSWEHITKCSQPLTLLVFYALGTTHPLFKFGSTKSVFVCKLSN